MFNPADLSKLTDTERTILQLKCSGMHYVDIADKLGYGKDAIQWYASSIYKKFGFKKEMHWKERTRILNEEVCPHLDKKEIVLVPQNPKPEPEPPDPVMLALVKLDEQKEEEETKVIAVKPTPITYPPPPPGRRPWLALALIASILCLAGVLGFTAIKFGPAIIAIATNYAQTPQTVVITATNDPQLLLPATQAATEAPTAFVPSDTPLPPTRANTNTPLPTNTIIPTPDDVLFEDNFNTGLNPAWKIISGQPVITNQTLTTSEDTWLEISDPSFTNFVITIKISVYDCWMNSGSYSAIGVRGTSTNDMVVFRWASCENEWDTVTSGEWKQVPNSHREDGLYGFSTLTIQVKDNQFSASVPQIFNTSIILLDQDLPSGTIFLKLGRKAEIDSFKVVKNP